MTRVAVDALGGDSAPGEVILGALDAAAEGVEIVLYGPTGLDTQGLPLVETTQVIDMADKPAESVRAFQTCGAELALGHHYGTFQLTDEPIDAPEHALIAARVEAGISPETFRVLKPGQVWEVEAKAMA